MGSANGYQEFLLSTDQNHPIKNFLWYQLPAIFWLILIFVLSSIPDLSGPDLKFKLQDKFYHFIFYAVFGVLIGRAFFFQTGFQQLKNNFLIFGIIFGSLYAMSDELHQHFVPGRTMSPWDALADVAGVIFGILIFAWWVKHKNLRQPDSD
jgi:VanZ family protein